MPFDLRQLKAFEAVARYGGFSRASREVGLTQPTLSTHISNLEKALGVRLFDRAGRSVSLTPAGRLLSGYVRRIMDLMDETVQAIESFNGQIRGNVHIFSSTVPGEYLLPRWLVRFHQRYPDVLVTLTVSDSTQVIKQVVAGEAPIGVTGTPAGDSGLDCRLLCGDRIILVLSPDLAAATGTGASIDPETLSAIPLIRREKGSGTQRAVESTLARIGLDVEKLNWTATLGSTRAVVEGALAGLGGTFLSASAVSRELSQGELRPVDVAGLDVERGFYLVTSGNRTLSPAAARLMEDLVQTGEGLAAF